MTAPIKINDPMKTDQNGKEPKKHFWNKWFGRKVKKKDKGIPNTDDPKFQITPGKKDGNGK